MNKFNKQQFIELLTVEEAASEVNLKVSRIRYAILVKEIPYIKIGRLVRIQRSALVDWINSNVTPRRELKRGRI